MGPRQVIALALAEIVALVGTRLSMIAIPWLVLTTTHDPLLTGVIGFAEMLPYVIAKALGGPLIDRLGARRVSIAADSLSVFAVALVPLLHFEGLLRFEALLPVVAIVGMLRGPADAAKQAMVPAIAARSGVAIERMTGIMGTIERMAGALGAAAAGAIIVVIGPAPALLLTSATCALATIIVAALLRGSPVMANKAVDQPGYVGQLREGRRYFRTDPVLVSIVLMVAITNLFDQAYVAVLLPVWASRIGDAALLGALLAAFSAAAVLGAGLATLFAPRLPRLLVYAVAYLVAGAPRYIIFVTDSPIAGVFATVAAAGLAAGFINPIISAVCFERIPAHMVGRVNSLIGALAWTLIPFGGLVGGALIAAVGLSNAFVLFAIGYFVTTMLPLALPAFRDIARPAPQELSFPANT